MSQSLFVFCTLLMAQCKVRATVYQQFVKLLPTLLLPAWGSNCSQNDTIDTIGCRICGSSLCKAVSRVKLEAVCGTNYVCPPPKKKDKKNICLSKKNSIAQATKLYLLIFFWIHILETFCSLGLSVSKSKPKV